MMPYTLMKGWAWVLAGVLLGIFIGWLVRSIAAKRQVARARSHHVDSVEMERLRGRLAHLEPVVDERDRLLAELEQCRARAVSSSVPGDQQTAASSEDHGSVPGVVDQASPAPAVSPAAVPDVASASAVLGVAITVDDLKVIDGIGPKIESLCHGIGIRTWFDMSTTEVSLLRTMLSDAGSRFSTHDPSTWPEQAGLLAAGRWLDFKALTDGLHGGRTVD
jgi:predicted flap endonuclease-1-like 5' DNA nuclease